jgi:predicted Zn-dependent protease
MARRFLSLLTAAAAILSLALPAQARVFVRDAEIERTLRMMSEPIFSAAGLSTDDVRMFVLLDPTLNAFVAGGRNMVLYTGLLRELKEPETVMGVIAHEVGHITGGHLVRRQIVARDLAGPALIASMLAAAAAAVAGAPQAGAALAIGGQQAAQRTILAFSRAEEAAADQAAVAYMNRAGVDPEGMLAILRLFKGQEVFQSGRIDPWAQSHPLSAERIALLEERIAVSPARGQRASPEIQYWHQRMRAKLDGFTDRPDRVLARLELEAEPDSELNLYRRAIALHRMPDPEAALRAVDRLIARRPNDPFYNELKGQILFESARPAEAVAAYRTAARLAPDEPLIAGYLGRALLASGQPGADAEALRILEAAVRDDPGEPGVLRDLAQAYARAGRDGDAALATAERLALVGDAEGAARMARRAMDLLPNGSPGWRRADDIASLDPRSAR